jgi:hypothetical protein
LKTLAPAPTALALGALALATLALGSTVPAATGGDPAPGPTPTVTATASAPAWTRAANPDWAFLETVRTSGMEFTRDPEADLAAAGVDVGETDTFELRTQVCASATDDGTGGPHRESQTQDLWLSTFHDEVRRMGRNGNWDIPRTVAYHHCPSRFAAVNAVEDFQTPPH